ncbi:hypothetical protein JCM31826_04380 [Thermaurantimonas aggregans]|uniref:site-specific DNA-methyltransferase (adenine-specific) n=1 Tax=Thermaurantimonas aggregans TaxID=2173829 RepID=A0A401XIX5_9FLAO|nr:DNA methyltransferase [Thermaurantimonas aggregans]GCD76956.1 hypothetical protein JCM31826_04380 [Thermaurantimonas aggregans]
MSLDKKDFSNYIKQFKFRELFNEMGWNNDKTTQPIIVDNETYTLQAVAEKSGFKILVCHPNARGLIPDYNTRKKIETKVTKLFQEHLIIFIDAPKTEQIWQLVVRQSGKPTKLSETRWHINQDPELLYQRASGIVFELDEEEHITIVDVTRRIAENFQQNNEKVTKQFYEKFKKEHGAFLSFIQGITDRTEQEWYASLMLNRLMFCYFIQKKGFLDNNKNYLRDKLNECKSKKEKIKFYSFYRDFLLVLFHKGLNEPNHSPATKIELGKIPYLNGGLFDEHEIEKNNTNIDIDDQAFERLFDFFDQYEWHLDTRHTASGRDINPDVIGYIFEKYINDRAQMGAYYTKEDITDYISKNCIIPWLFDETQRHYPKAFNPEGEIWQMVKQSGGCYIYDAVKKGTDIENLDFGTSVSIDDPHHPLWNDLPEEIRAGFRPDLKDKPVSGEGPHLWELRKEWNKPAPTNIALPTEIYRELIERRKRYWELRKKIEAGEITQINDFITYNLNIRQFAQDVVENTNDPELLKHFYKALNSVTILDPTCGSGAFLFAAMNILEPLYEACLQRMENFVAEAPKGKYKFFEETLAQVKSPEHPNLQYFIYKSIILQNLYGVDIMKEAVEIAKLRLFLKLVATVEADYRKPNLGLEPLPDIDFNIRAGNTLVGFATEAELQNAFAGKLDFDNDTEKIKEKCDIVARTFKRFKEIQLTTGDNHSDFKQAKDELHIRLKQLTVELDQLLAKAHYGIDITNKEKYTHWLQTHQPFHWFAEFYEIVQGNGDALSQSKGGFDVIIGNPPYVEYSTAKKNYILKDYECLSSGNLYSFVIERSIKIQKDGSYNGMIIPLSAYCTDRMASFQEFEFENCSEIFLSYYAERPSKLFEGAERNLVISLFRKQVKTNIKKIYTTYYYKWNSTFREFLFENISYTEAKSTIIKGIVPKISSTEELSIIKKLRAIKKNIGFFTSRNKTNHYLYYRNSGGRYWKIITDFQPKFILNSKPGVSSRESYLYFNDNTTLQITVAILNSSIYYWYYVMHSDARTNNPSDLKEFPVDIDKLSEKIKKKLLSVCNKLMKDLDKNSIMQQARYQTGDVEFQQFFPQKSKGIIDEIDIALAEYYGLNEKELEFILNYDLKFRMGKEVDEE